MELSYTDLLVTSKFIFVVFSSLLTLLLPLRLYGIVLSKTRWEAQAIFWIFVLVFSIVAFNVLSIENLAKSIFESKSSTW